MITIAISNLGGDGHSPYSRWLESIAPELTFNDLSRGSDPAASVETSHGLLLTGGGDPDPVLYGKPELAKFCDIDAERDRMEIAAMHAAVKKNIPVLGICRGLQIANVALGGSLIADLPHSGFDGHHKIEVADRLHEITVEADTLLERITGMSSEQVNSAHHQGVDVIAPGLRASAKADDGIIEALEWEKTEGKAFFLLMHWHPERLADWRSPFGNGIAEAFIWAVRWNMMH